MLSRSPPQKNAKPLKAVTPKPCLTLKPTAGSECKNSLLSRPSVVGTACMPSVHTFDRPAAACYQRPCIAHFNQKRPRILSTMHSGTSGYSSHCVWRHPAPQQGASCRKRGADALAAMHGTVYMTHHWQHAPGLLTGHSSAAQLSRGCCHAMKGSIAKYYQRLASLHACLTHSSNNCNCYHVCCTTATQPYVQSYVYVTS